MNTHINIYLHIHAYSHKPIHAYAHTHIHSYTHIYAYTHNHRDIYTPIYVVFNVSKLVSIGWNSNQSHLLFIVYLFFTNQYIINRRLFFFLQKQN